MKKIIFSLLALVLIAVQGHAQGTLSVPSTTYTTGSISVPVTASGFNDVGGFSLKMTLNAASSLSTVDLDTTGTVLSGSGRNADLSISVSGNTVTINYTDLSVGAGFNLNGTVPLVKLALNFTGTPTSVIWDTDPNATSFSDALGSTLPLGTFYQRHHQRSWIRCLIYIVVYRRKWMRKCICHLRFNPNIRN